MDACANSKQFFNPNFRFWCLLHPACLWKHSNCSTDETTKTIIILHIPDIRDQLESNLKEAAKLTPMMRENMAISPEWQSK